MFGRKKEVDYQNSNWRQESLLKKIPEKKRSTPEQSRRAVLFLLLVTFIFIGGSLAYREVPKILKKIKPVTQPVDRVVFNNKTTLTPTPPLQEEKKAIELMTQLLEGEYGLYFEAIDATGLRSSNPTFSIDGDNKFMAASMIKLPVLITLYREAEAGRVNLDQEYSLKQSDKWAGSGSLYNKPIGTKITYRRVAELMGQESDNTAWHIAENLLGSDLVQRTIDQLGMKNTSYLDRKTTPNDIGLLFRKLYSEKVVNSRDRDEILGYLTKTIYEDRIPAGVPEGVKVAHKVGSEIRVVSDGGIVFADKPFILVILSQDVNEVEAKKALPEITRKIYGMYEGS